jgi:hypothetical protein
MEQGLCHRLGKASVHLQTYRGDQSVPQAYSEFIASGTSLSLVYRIFATLSARHVVRIACVTFPSSLLGCRLRMRCFLRTSPLASNRQLFVDGAQLLHNIVSLRSTSLLQLPLRS